MRYQAVGDFTIAKENQREKERRIGKALLAESDRDNFDRAELVRNHSDRWQNSSMAGGDSRLTGLHSS